MKNVCKVLGATAALLMATQAYAADQKIGLGVSASTLGVVIAHLPLAGLVLVDTMG